MLDLLFYFPIECNSSFSCCFFSSAIHYDHHFYTELTNCVKLFNDFLYQSWDCLNTWSLQLLVNIRGLWLAEFKAVQHFMTCTFLQLPEAVEIPKTPTPPPLEPSPIRRRVRRYPSVRAMAKMWVALHYIVLQYMFYLTSKVRNFDKSSCWLIYWIVAVAVVIYHLLFSPKLSLKIKLTYLISSQLDLLTIL